MGNFKHHNSFAKEKHIQAYLFPYACFVCRKSFKKPQAEEGRKCPDCDAQMVQLSRKFKPPKKNDVEAWIVVEFVVKAGFRYQSVHIENGKQATYPTTMKEAEAFVLAHQGQLKLPAF